MRKISLFCSASTALALISVSSAHGQTNMSTGQGTSAASVKGQPASTDNETTGLADIVVTAQRRGQNLQDVPIAVTALTAGQLAAKGGTSSQDLTASVPGVVFNNGGGGGQITIRGIGGTNSGVDAGNAVYVDGVYQFAPQSNVFDFNAIERIEILKGPQGTLFGRNSAGGLVHVITRDPAHEASGEANVGYANYDTLSGNVYLNAPVTETLAANVAAFGWKQNDGWGKNLFDGNDVHKGYAWGVRGKIKWEAPDGDTDIILSGTYSRTKPAASDAASIIPGTFSLFGTGSSGSYNVNNDYRSYQLFKQYTLAGTIHHDLGSVRVTSITAYDSANATFAADGDYSPVPFFFVNFNSRFRTFSQEVHLQSDGSGPLEWLLGGLYLHNTTPGIFEIGGFPTSFTTTKTTAYAAFGQATYAITDATKLTAGLRYTEERSVLTAPGVANQQAKASKPTWRLAIDHKFSRNIMTYASYSRGFKSGLFNATYPEGGAADPQRLDAFEIGFKGETSDRRARLNVAAYHYEFKDVQIQLFTPGALGYISNASDARANGIDADLAFEPVSNLILTASANYMESKYTRNAVGFNCYAAPATGGLVTVPCDLKGRRLAFAPKVTFSLGVEYRIPTEVGEFTLSALEAHNSGYDTDTSNFSLARTGRFDRVNASVGWVSTSKMLSASVWIKNAFDDRTLGNSFLAAPFGATGFTMPPRTFGVTIGAKY